MGTAWLRIGLALLLLGVIVAILIYGLGAVMQVLLWLVKLVGVLFFRILGLFIRFGRCVVDRIRDARW
ncbi:hypothetical protein I6B53_10310 [Schaalia sp. 19OD2882]|uniref:hypothetical protein n=1 Tax=Schaalia sp. 19OD2882 TaxID=2794089 RepID=UPI001C1ECA16|nr:hypothetical protein [Schaalia sp. 19OD2882]QWW19457.1 hypothetical protein I6B53_10310 [Schaalia sp. 19OD2882]